MVSVIIGRAESDKEENEEEKANEGKQKEMSESSRVRRSLKKRYKEFNDIAKGTTERVKLPNDVIDENSFTGLSRIFLRDNILLGPPRLRQIRVVEKSCEVHEAFFTYFTNCYAGYTASKENTTKLYKYSKFYTMSELQVRALRGQITTYYGAGFVTNLSYNFEENQRILDKLKRNKWIDRGTRLIVLEFVLFNINANLFDNVKILAEIPPVGGIVPSHQFQALKLHNLWSESDLLLQVASGVYYFLVLCYTIQNISRCKTIGLKLFFYSIWNFLDVLVLSLSYLSLAYNLFHFWQMRAIIKRAQTKHDDFVSIDNICYCNLIYVDMMAICVFLVWIKIFKYISFNRTMSQFSTTLRRCAKDICGFAVMFFVVFLAYAQLGLLIFGASHPDFRKFGISVISLMRMFLGDFEYRLIENANHVLGPIYFLTYVIFVFFILLNMFLAIINDTYAAVKDEVHKSHSNFGPYLNRLFKQIFSFCIKRKNDVGMNESLPSHQAATDRNSPQIPATSSIRKRASEIFREYFVELTEFDDPKIPVLPQEGGDIQRFNQRLSLLEEVLEQLINNMDLILKKIESKKKSGDTKNRKVE